MRAVTMPCSFGEAADKMTILRIKSERMRDPAQLAHVREELALVSENFRVAVEASAALDALIGRLKTVNEQLWEVEDDIRACERRGDFGPDFVRLARTVYQANDLRAALKRELNALLGSSLVEEKFHGEPAARDG